MNRRGDGELERAVLHVLWAAEGQPVTPATVLDRLSSDLAYTTVMTVLTRLHDKGLANRERRGRAFAYTATGSESDLIGDRMRANLSSSSDRIGALSGFVGGLNANDVSALRALLAGEDE